MNLLFLLFSGTLMQFYALFLSFKLFKRNKEVIGNIRYLIPCLIFSFVLGYLFFLVHIITNQKSTNFNNLPISYILFFGAIFAVIVLKIGNKLINALNEEKDKFKKANEELENNFNLLAYQKEKLIKNEKKLQDTTEKLTTTMDDFYTLRLNLEKETNNADIKTENEVVKDRMDRIRE